MPPPDLHRYPDVTDSPAPPGPPKSATDRPVTATRLATLVLGPLVALVVMLLPAPEGMPDPAWRLVALTLWMVIWWLGEALPIAATALLPIVMMPPLGILPVAEVTQRYGNPLIFLFLGGFILAAGMQRWGLHRRIALAIVAAIGTSPGRVVLGFMLATAGLSMWISNTATVVMMFAVGTSVIDFIDDRTHDKALVRRFGVSLMLGVGYAASIGGVGTLIGTPPNALLASFLADSYGIRIGFFQWMLIGVPVVAVMLPLTWVLLTRLVFPARGLNLAPVREVIATERARLGPMALGEKMVAMVFATAAALWVLRGFLDLPVGDSGIAIGAALMLFALPVGRQAGFLLDWSIARSLPWGILLLFGGGLAIASAFEATDLASWIGDRVAGLGAWPTWALILAVAGVVILLTEITSNTASTATFLPILGAVAVGLGLSVEWLTVPVALGASMAFMMPVATPPNAIVFSYDQMRLSDMVRAGIVLNVLSLGTIFLAMLLIAPAVFGL